MNRDVKVGDKIVVSKYNGNLCQREAIVTEVYTVTIDVQFCDSGELAVLYRYPSGLDEWEFAEDFPKHSQDDVEVGDKILVTKVNGEALEAPHLTEVTDVGRCGESWVRINPAIRDEDMLYAGEDLCDEWVCASEASVKHHEEETLQHRQAHAYYDDEALSPSYSDAVKAGMTFAEYTGVNITEESLDFEPKEEEVLRGITAESLNFEEAPKSDAVNHPSHYNYGDIEVIDFIEQVTEQYEDGFDAYIVGNALKYLARSPHKNGLEDVKKAVWYLGRLIERNGGRVNG